MSDIDPVLEILGMTEEEYWKKQEEYTKGKLIQKGVEGYLAELKGKIGAGSINNAREATAILRSADIVVLGTIAKCGVCSRSTSNFLAVDQQRFVWAWGVLFGKKFPAPNWLCDNHVSILKTGYIRDAHADSIRATKFAHAGIILGTSHEPH